MSMVEDFGEPISTYTDRQAIEDGVLAWAPSTAFPNCLLTAGVHAAIVEALEKDGRTTEGDYREAVAALLLDVRALSIANQGDQIYCEDGLDGNITGRRLWFAANGIGGLTVMFPEDY